MLHAESEGRHGPKSPSRLGRWPLCSGRASTLGSARPAAMRIRIYLRPEARRKELQLGAFIRAYPFVSCPFGGKFYPGGGRGGGEKSLDAMNCGACRHENPDGSAFCEECGVRLERHCPSCESV